MRASRQGAPGQVAIQKRLQDEVLTLAEAHFLGKRSDIFWITTLEFLRRHELETSQRQSEVTFSGRFLRQTYGPVCPEVYDSTRQLLEAGLLEEDARGRARTITPLGERLFATLQSSIDEPTLIAIRDLSITLKRLTFGQLKRRVYALEVNWNGRMVPVADIPIGACIYNHPTNWLQVVPTDVLKSFHASLESSKPCRISDEIESLEELEEALA